MIQAPSSVYVSNHSASATFLHPLQGWEAHEQLAHCCSGFFDSKCSGSLIALKALRSSLDSLVLPAPRSVDQTILHWSHQMSKNEANPLDSNRPSKSIQISPSRHRAFSEFPSASAPS